jgi:hypothetical protein
VEHSVSGINPQPGPVNPGADNLNTQLESPMLVVKQKDIWAQTNQQRFHDEALQWFGEECIVRQLWRAEDAALGLVGYCQQCQDSPNPSNPTASVQSRVSNVYRQTGNSYCTECYGTTFSGGFKPTCYHLYMLAADTPQIRSNLSTGQFWKNNPQVQFSWFPEIRTGDLVVRVTSWSNGVPTALGDRFQVSAVTPQSVRTGPGVSYDPTMYVNQMCTLENVFPSAPYYNVPVI